MYWWREYVKEQFAGEQNRWFLWLPVLFGIGIGSYFLLPEEISLWWTLGIIESLIILAIVFRFRPAALAILMVVSMMILGFANIQLKAYYLSKLPQLTKQEKVYVSGRIAKTDYNYRGNPRLKIENAVDFDKTRNFGTIKVTLRGKNQSLKPGECVEMAASLMPRPQTAMVGGYQFDRKAYFEEISANGYALSQVYPIDCETKAGFGESFNFAVDNLRSRIITHIREVLPPDEASVTAAIVAGEQGVISRKIIQNYRDSGLAHFLSISGLHMSMIAGLMFFLVRLIIAFIPPLAVRYDSKKPAAIMAICISIFYLLISGAEVPAQRAFIMNFIVVLGIFLSRRATSMKTISIAALIVLILAPQALIGASFQMSFAAVVALIAFYERYAGALHRFLSGDRGLQSLPIKIIKGVWIYIIGILVADFVASMATMPFAIYHFNRIAVYTTLANLLAGPIIGLVIMPFVLIALLLMPLGLDYWPLKLVGFGISKINEITAWVSGLPGAGYQVLSMPLWGLLLIIFGALWLCLWNMPWRKWGWFAILVGSLSVFMVKTPDMMVDAEGEVLAVKDNQGDLVILPSRGNNFIKQIWLEKTANKKLDGRENKLLKKIYEGGEIDKTWLDLDCNKQSCIYKNIIKYDKSGSLEISGQPFDMQKSLGASIYIDNGKARIKTVRGYVGDRYWN